MRGRWLVIAALAACGHDGGHVTLSPDASTVMTYRLAIGPAAGGL